MKQTMLTRSDDPAEMIFDQFDNLWGKLDPEIRRRLKRLMDNPTDKTWDDAHGIILRFGDGFRMGLTLWQAWIATDPGALRIGPVSTLHGKREKWSKVPSKDAVYAALIYAAERNAGK